MRFSKIALVICAAAAVGSAALANQGAESPLKAADLSDKTWLRKSQQILHEAQGTDVPDWLKPTSKVQMYEKDAREIYEAAAPIVSKAITGKEQAAPNTRGEDVAPLPEDGRVTIFASLSMPEAELRDLFREAAAHSDKTVVVFRGVEKDKPIDSLVASIQKYLPQESEQVPNVDIDPEQFKRLKVEVVPYISYVKNGHEYLARGIYGVDWIMRRANFGEEMARDFGRHGPVYPIKEPDIIEEMRRRWDAIDKDKMKKDMVARFWKGQAKQMATYLPDAVETKVYEFDPTVELTADIPDGNGGFLARAGDKLNPADHLPLTRRYIFFNGSKKNHVEAAKALGKEAEKNGRPAVYITSYVNPANGWDHLAKLEETFDAPVLTLETVFAERFKIERLPAMLYYENGKAWIKEFNASEFLAQQGGRKK